MSPQEVFEYKLRWKPNAYIAHVHSDLDIQCKTWCRKRLQRHEWSMDVWTAVYSHTFYFEHEIHLDEFKKQFKEWIGKGRQ